MARTFCFSEYIARFRVTPGDRFVLATRVSERVQERRGNLVNQQTRLAAAVTARGGEVVDAVAHVGHGWDPFWLTRAVRLAKRHGAILLAETTDRFIRHSRYHSILRPRLQAGWDEFEELLEITKGVMLMTHADPGKVRSHQTERGQETKQKKGGRPKKKKVGRPRKPRRPKEYGNQNDPDALAKTKWLSVSGRSLSFIAEATGRPKSTIQGLRDRMDADGTLRPAKIQSGGEVPPELRPE